MADDNPSEKIKETTTAAGYLLTAPGLALLSAVFVLAAWHSQAGPLLLAGLFLSMAGLARLWSRLSLAGVQAERCLRGTRFFPGEAIDLRLRLLNRKPLPLAWVQIEDSLPAGIRPEEAGGQPAPGPVRRSASLLWYRGITWNLRLTAERRGYYPMGPLKLASGDLLGLYSRTRSAGGVEHLIVYPRIFPVDTRWIPSLYPMGEVQSARRLFRDPTHTIGVREYQHGDSLKFIHWKASARGGELRAKVLAATTAFKVAVFLDVESFRIEGTLADEDFELGLSAAGSIAAALCERGSPVGLFVNTRLADSGQPAAIAPGAGHGRLTEILETLAKVTGRSSGPLASLLEKQRNRLPAGATLVVVAALPPGALIPVLSSLKDAGFKILVILIGPRGDPALPPEVPWRRVKDADDLGGGRRT